VSPDDNDIVMTGLLILMGLVIYFFPTIIARSKKKRNAVAIFAVNLFLGWTLVGWVIALVWALTVEPDRAG
jgi:uncharacterized membrane protein